MRIAELSLRTTIVRGLAAATAEIRARRRRAELNL
jgi:hypothetical protein